MHLARRTRVAIALAIALVAGGAGTAAVAASEGSSLGARPVFLVRSDNTVDASVAGAAAARAGAPLLYTDPGSLEASTRDYLTSYQPTKVVLVGGTASLSTTVEASITTLGFPCVRLAGADRSETATMLASLVAKFPAARGEKGDSGPAGPPGPAGAGAPRLVDHASRVLGTYLGGGVLTPTGYEVGLSLHNDRVEYRPRLYFQAAGCTGTPYDDVWVSNYLPYRTNSVEWSSYFGGYVSRTYMAPNTFVAQSELTFDANSGTYVCGPSTYAVKGVTFDVFTPATVGLPATISYPLTIQQ